MDKLRIKKKNMTKIKIENIEGQILFSKDIHADEYVVNIKDLKPGIYFVELQSEDGTFANKFIKY